ncbi:hypothetical protein AHAS_Ahas02G0100200 [Arachis hypogaea]
MKKREGSFWVFYRLGFGPVWVWSNWFGSLVQFWAKIFKTSVKIRVVDLEDGEFRIGMEYCSRKSVVAAIRSYTISREVDYNVYEFKLQTFYAKCKTYRHGCNWCIRASLI